MDERLIDLGFAPEELSPSQRTQLDESGFAIFESVIDPAWREKLQQAFEQVFEREGEQAGKVHSPGTELLNSHIAVSIPERTKISIASAARGSTAFINSCC